jgi:DNA polymerase theta
VSEVLMLRTLLQRKKKAIFILPFVSVVAEKADYLSKMFKSMDICVHGFYANKVPSSMRHALNVAVSSLVFIFTRACNLLPGRPFPGQ